VGWARYGIVGVVTLLILVFITPVVAVGIGSVDEPLRTIAILLIGIAVFLAVDRVLLRFFPGLGSSDGPR
jgi:hypothetical protein